MAVTMWKGLILATLLAAPAAQAENLNQIGGPANPPPASFKGQQFVDSRGCLFLRAGYSTGVNWVARVDRNHQPICSMVPTGSAAAVAAVEADMAPETQAVAQNQPTPRATAPVQTTTAAVQAPARQAATTPVATVPVRQAAPTYQSAGVATSVAGVQCYDQAPVLERVAVSGGTALVCTRGDGTATGWLPPRAANAAAAQVAAQTVPVVTAPVYVTAPAQGATTAPVRLVTVQVAPVQAQPVATRSHALPKPPKGWVYAWKDDRLNPLRGQGTPTGQSQQDQVWQRTIPMVLVTEPAPQTAFQRALGIRPKASVQQPAVRTNVSTMNAAATQPAQRQAAPVVQVAASPQMPVASGGGLIQVGCFGDPANAQGVVARLQAAGLPVSTANVTRKGKALQVIYAGPFASAAEAASGLATVHNAGFADAFLR